MLTLMSLGVMLFLIVSLVMGLSMLLSSKTLGDREKSSPFECGFDPVVSSRLPFSLRFFLIALIFLIFDVEIVLLLPSIPSFSEVEQQTWVLNLVFFLVVLLVGLYYEWNYGALDWSL
uniref:NADH-ubiquinone oxidoreductase chain 3 n=1 Tax=Leptestheria brevirostris TaxID=2653809 RepID=A0A7M1ICM5_9CRUS|nr:NADH dehydrogenase subunit 3 [Leptestheria brevirostris]QOQ37311.1 NADH dehydrogenase subunit 3 [Leptestheria brevirostris]